MIHLGAATNIWNNLPQFPISYTATTATNDECLTEFTLKTHATGSYVSSLKSIPLFLVTIRDFSSIFALGSLQVITPENFMMIR